MAFRVSWRPQLYLCTCPWRWPSLHRLPFTLPKSSLFLSSYRQPKQYRQGVLFQFMLTSWSPHLSGLCQIREGWSIYPHYCRTGAPKDLLPGMSRSFLWELFLGDLLSWRASMEWPGLWAASLNVLPWSHERWYQRCFALHRWLNQLAMLLKVVQNCQTCPVMLYGKQLLLAVLGSRHRSVAWKNRCQARIPL